MILMWLERMGKTFLLFLIYLFFLDGIFHNYVENYVLEMYDSEILNHWSYK